MITLQQLRQDQGMILHEENLQTLHEHEFLFSLVTYVKQKLPESIIDKKEMWNHIYEKYICIEKEESVLYDREGNPVPRPQKDEDQPSRYISLEQDAEYIFASFQQAYHMNLFEQQG